MIINSWIKSYVNKEYIVTNIYFIHHINNNNNNNNICMICLQNKNL